MTDKAERLARIEAAKVTTLRYGRAVDNKDVAALRADVFTADIVLHIPTGDLHGIDAVADFYAGAFDAGEMGTRRHFLTNQIAECTGTETVEVESYFLFVGEDDASAIGWGVYRDIVLVTDAGLRIADKTIDVEVATSLGEGWARSAR